MKINDVLSIGSGNAENITTSGSSQETAMPTPDQGPLRYVIVTCSDTAFIRFGFAGETCTDADFMVIPGQGFIFIVAGYTHFHVLQVLGAVSVTVYPLENG